MSDVTQLLEAVRTRETGASEALWEAVYSELHQMAAQRMAGERAGHTLQPTALVHEAFLRLGGGQEGGAVWQGRAHFFSAAAQAMRRILVDRARRRMRQKHGGGAPKLHIEDLDLADTTDDPTLLLVNEALDKLNQADPVGAELIRLRFFAGLSNVDAAELIGLPERTAKRAWAYARAWLYEEIKRRL